MMQNKLHKTLLKQSNRSNPGNESVLQRFILLAITCKSSKKVKIGIKKS